MPPFPSMPSLIRPCLTHIPLLNTTAAKIIWSVFLLQKHKCAFIFAYFTIFRSKLNFKTSSQIFARGLDHSQNTYHENFDKKDDIFKKQKLFDRHRRSHGGGGVRDPLPNRNAINDKNEIKKTCFFSFTFFLHFRVQQCTRTKVIKNNIDNQGARALLNSIFANQFKYITRVKLRVFALKLGSSGPHVTFLWT